MTDFKVTDEAVEAAGAAFHGVKELMWDEESMRAALEAALLVMFRQCAWIGLDRDVCGYVRLFENEKDFAHLKDKDWFSAAPLYRIKEPK